MDNFAKYEQISSIVQGSRLLPYMKKSIADLQNFIAGDKTIIKEVLHPKNEAVNINYSLAHATIRVGEASEPHILTHSSELYYILEGQGRAYVDGIITNLKKDELLLIPAGAKQHIVNTGDSDLQFLCVVSPPWQAEEEEILD